MDIRRIQGTGGSSYTLTLPKEWVKANGLSKNDSVYVGGGGKGPLSISPIKSKSQEKKKTISVGPDTTGNMLTRLLISAYLMGHTIIEVESAPRIVASHRQEISGFVRKAIGPEIMDERPDRIIIKDIINPTEIDVKNSMRRLKTLISSMHLDAARALHKQEVSLARDIVERDMDVDRINWLISHQYNILRSDPKRAFEMGFGADEGHFNFLTSWVSERIADHAKRIAKNIEPLFKDELFRDEFCESARLAAQIYSDAMDSHLDSNIGLANRTVDGSAELSSQARLMVKGALEGDAKRAYPILKIAESIKRSGEYSAHICEFVLDRLIDRV